jgi:hypothetical protein
VAATALDSGGVSYEDFVRLHAEEFGRYLTTLLGREAEGHGGRVAVDDTLQEALLRIHAEWPELEMTAGHPDDWLGRVGDALRHPPQVQRPVRELGEDPQLTAKLRPGARP